MCYHPLKGTVLIPNYARPLSFSENKTKELLRQLLWGEFSSTAGKYSCFESWWHANVVYSYFWITAVSEGSFSPQWVKLFYRGDNIVLSSLCYCYQCVAHIWASQHICSVFICIYDQLAYLFKLQGIKLLKIVCSYYL